MNLREMSDIDAFNTICPVINISQDPEEIIWFMEQIRMHIPAGPMTILEIGCWTGGNLAFLSRLLGEGGLLIGMNPRTEHHEDWIREREVADISSPAMFQYLDCASNDPDAFQRLVRVLGGQINDDDTFIKGRGLDVIFMDHTDVYEDAKYDYDTYRTLMNVPGVMGWHDTGSYPNACGQVWAEARESYPGHKIQTDSTTSGIGMIWFPEMEGELI